MKFRMLKKTGEAIVYPYTEALAARDDMTEMMMTKDEILGVIKTKANIKPEPQEEP